MKLIGILDVETTGTDHTKDRLLEVGAVVFSVPLRRVVSSRSWLVKGAESNPAQHINGIPIELVNAHGYAKDKVLPAVHAFVSSAGGCDVLTAWNASFDEPWFEGSLGAVPWFDAMDDLEWPQAGSSRKIVEVALAHGVPLVDAHRALTDCSAIARLLQRVAHDFDRLDQGRAEGGEPTEMPGSFETWLERAFRPKATVVAPAGYDPDANAVYKEHRFKWNIAEQCPHLRAGEKRWWRRMFHDDAEKLPFRVTTVGP